MALSYYHRAEKIQPENLSVQMNIGHCYVEQKDYEEALTEGWKSLGKQRADTTCLDWIVPDNALFWLRDLTRGREEHIFFMQNRRQKFPTF